MSSESSGPDMGGQAVGFDELVELISKLEQENERLRQRHLEVLIWMEEAVTDQVAWERSCGELERQLAAVQAELDAIRGTMTWRTLAPIRRAYACVRKRAWRA